MVTILKRVAKYCELRSHRGLRDSRKGYNDGRAQKDHSLQFHRSLNKSEMYCEDQPEQPHDRRFQPCTW